MEDDIIAFCSRGGAVEEEVEVVVAAAVKLWGGSAALILNLLIKWARGVGVGPVSAGCGPSKRRAPAMGARASPPTP